MESANVKEIFMRSDKVYWLRYQPFIGDSDSSLYNLVVKSMPYGPLVHVEKAECTNHINKRMGSRLQKMVKGLNDNLFFKWIYTWLLDLRIHLCCSHNKMYLDGR